MQISDYGMQFSFFNIPLRVLSVSLFFLRDPNKGLGISFAFLYLHWHKRFAMIHRGKLALQHVQHAPYFIFSS